MVYQRFQQLLADEIDTARIWPVGQVVKTEASHAFNIGSNPVRVTISPKRYGSPLTKTEQVHMIVFATVHSGSNSWC